MQIENGQLVLGTRECWTCHGTREQDEVVKVACEVCGGSGRGPRGGKNKCRHCINGWGYNYKHTDNKITCKKCEGTGELEEDFYDHIDEEIWKSLEFKVVATMHRQTFAEAHIGAGCYSVTDYCDWRNGSAGDLIEKVRDRNRGGYPQACKIIRDVGYRTYLPEGAEGRRETDPRMPDFVGIFLNTQGYTVAAVHGQEVKV